tara:strand:+ start:251 stop:583 length:333 start_codon:yes stop_codon:yes gene_type:complete
MESISTNLLIKSIGINQNLVVRKNIKMIKIKTTVTDCYEQAREALKAGDEDKARDMADYGIVKVAEARCEGMGVDDELDDVRIGLWLERFWYFLENNNLMLDGELPFATR